MRHTVRNHTARVLGLATLTAGLAVAGGAEMAQAAPAPAGTSLRATAALRDTAGQVTGQATFEPAGMGVRVTVRVTGLTPGQHGMHVHDAGRCTPGVDAATNTVVPFGGAGGHFDPGTSGNHDSPTAGNKYGHGGDLPMLTVGADGTGQATFTTMKLALSGATGILARSLVVHAQPDDYKSDPSGLTGARERCGVIVRDGLSARDYPLPGAQTYPEGVAYDVARGTLYTGSAATGTIYAVNAATGTVRTFAEGGGQGRGSALGLKVDGSGRVWVAGGATGTVSVLNPDGFPVAILRTPPSPNAYVNDLVAAPDGNVYVTDSSRPVIFRVTPDLKLSAWLDLAGTPLKYGPGINLNGIVATPDGRALLAVQMNTGVLWRIDLATRAVIRVMGGLTRGDGMLLDGRTLYVVRNAEGIISKVALNAAYTAGTVVAEEPVTGLRFPTTLTAVGGDLVVAQGQLNKLQGGTPETPFVLTRFTKF